jgi:hypothetical protein
MRQLGTVLSREMTLLQQNKAIIMAFEHFRKVELGILDFFKFLTNF